MGTERCAVLNNLVRAGGTFQRFPSCYRPTFERLKERRMEKVVQQILLKDAVNVSCSVYLISVGVGHHGYAHRRYHDE
jgi:hypothetical protein